MSLTKVGPKHQVTIPRDVFEHLELEVGDYLDVRIKGAVITMAPARLVPNDEAWFHAPGWQRKEREADGAIARREVSGPFATAEELLRHLGGKRRGARKRA